MIHDSTKPLLLAASLALGALSNPAAARDGSAAAMLMSESGDSVGTVTLTSAANGTLVHAELVGFPPGAHAFHIHAVGKCAPSFKAAAGHYNPDDSNHGFVDGDGIHAGDLPNIFVPESGTLTFDAFASAVRLDDRLFDADGAAIVVHQGPDDYKSDPAGAAGPRIACGVIERK